MLPATPSEVWKALTRSEELSSWFEAEVEIDAAPRGRVTARHRDGRTVRGVVVAANRPWRLVLAWNDGDADGSRVEFTLEAVPEGTCLTVTETPASELGPERALLGAAW
jgi:uncharacterized protein YndB with AHSA1/START domain